MPLISLRHTSFCTTTGLYTRWSIGSLCTLLLSSNLAICTHLAYRAFTASQPTTCGILSSQAKGQPERNCKSADHSGEQYIQQRSGNLQLLKGDQCREADDSPTSDIGEHLWIANVGAGRCAAHDLTDERGRQGSQEEDQDSHKHVGNVGDECVEDTAH